jgi:hypothetical protein
MKHRQAEIGPPARNFKVTTGTNKFNRFKEWNKQGLLSGTEFIKNLSGASRIQHIVAVMKVVMGGNKARAGESFVGAWCDVEEK